MAGFFTFLVHTSHRCANGQSSRRLKLTDEAIMGESLQKRKASWQKWAAAREGMSVNDWAGPWMDELGQNHLPGVDFLVLAPNASMDAWINRPAEYRDFSRAFHTLLMVYGGETPETVTTYTPHGCRHVQVTAGMQLAAQGLMTDSALERLGHWEKGSKMPRHYDSEACVTELQTRKTVTSAYRGGWRPASDGSMPAPATPAMGMLVSPTTPAAAPTAPVAAPQLEKAEQAGSEPLLGTAVKVFDTQRRKYHLVVPPNVKSRCFFWTCGTAEEPASNADFTYRGHGHQCVKCFFR